MMLAVPADSYGLRHASDPSFFEGRCAMERGERKPPEAGGRQKVARMPVAKR